MSYLRKILPFLSTVLYLSFLRDFYPHSFPPSPSNQTEPSRHLHSAPTPTPLPMIVVPPLPLWHSSVTHVTKPLSHTFLPIVTVAHVTSLIYHELLSLIYHQQLLPLQRTRSANVTAFITVSSRYTVHPSSSPSISSTRYYPLRYFRTQVFHLYLDQASCG